MKRPSRFWRGFIVGSLCFSLPLSAALTTVTIAPSTPDFTGVTDLGNAADLVEPIREPEYRPLQLRYGCKWGNPGSHPFTGDIYSALRTLGVDKESAKVLTDRIKRKDSDDEAVFSNAGVRDTHHWYVPTYSMAFGNSMCYGTRTNFKDLHYERAEVYWLGEYIIAVPRVCGNITRLQVREAAPDRETRELPEPSTTTLILAGLITLWRAKNED